MTKFLSAAVIAVTSTGAMAGTYTADVLTAMEVARAANVCEGRGTLTDAVFTENGQVRATCSGVLAGSGAGLSPLAAGGIVAGALAVGLLASSGDDDDDDDGDDAAASTTTTTTTGN